MSVKFNSIGRRVAAGLAAVATVTAFSAAGAQTIAAPASGVMEQMAADYVRYREDVKFVEEQGFTAASDIREAHLRLAGHNPAALANGWLVYAAFVAADTPEFQDGLKRVAGKRRARADFLAKLNVDPLLPGTVKGADVAIQRVLVSAVKDSQEFARVGGVFKSQAYEMQRTDWGVKKISESSSVRLAEATAYRAARGAAPAVDMSPEENRGVTAPALAALGAPWKPDWAAGDAGSPVLSDRAGGTLDRVMYLATLFALDQKDPETVALFASNKAGSRCISRKQDLLAACISATQMPYEEAFCIGEHGLEDIGECVGAVAQ